MNLIRDIKLWLSKRKAYHETIEEFKYWRGREPSYDTLVSLKIVLDTLVDIVKRENRKVTSDIWCTVFDEPTVTCKMVTVQNNDDFVSFKTDIHLDHYMLMLFETRDYQRTVVELGIVVEENEAEDVKEEAN